MKEKSVVIVLDEDKYKEQEKVFYEARKTSIQIHNGNAISELKKYKKALKEILKWNDPVIHDYETYSIAKEALSK